jgi:hypothetical protein
MTTAVKNPGIGRPRGSSNPLTRRTEAAVAATGESDLMLALARIADDATVDLTVRLEAARRLHGVASGRIYRSAIEKEEQAPHDPFQ